MDKRKAFFYTYNKYLQGREIELNLCENVMINFIKRITGHMIDILFHY